MANPLNDLRDLVAPTTRKTLLGTVEKQLHGKVSVRLVGGNVITVWGTAPAKAEVLIRDGSIVATIGSEDVPVVYIP